MKPLLLAGLILPAIAYPQERHEIGLTLGAVTGPDRGSLKLSRGTALQANYGFRLVGSETAALFLEVHFLANPQRTITSTDTRVTRDVASLYLTPGLRLKFLPQSRIQPYAAIGGGYALYEQSTTVLSGGPNPASRTLGRGALMFGGGVDIPVFRWFGFRAEVRDFYSGNPAFNITVPGAGQHNVILGGGFSLHF